MSTNQSGPWFASTIGLACLIVGYVIANGMNTGVPSMPSAGGTTGGGAASSAAASVALPPPTTDTPAKVDDDPMLGKSDAPVTLIEFTDYQCPFCSRHFTQTYGQIKTNYIDTGKVKFVSRDYPLSFHPFAQKAAEAAECANKQKKFFEMHDLLFSKQAEWVGSADAAAAIVKFKGYAADLKLNAADFATCIDTGATAAEIAKDFADGSASGITGTPGFWILAPDGTGQKISGAFPYATFSAAFDAILAKQ